MSLLQGPKFSGDNTSWWDGNRWKPLSEGPPVSADGNFWWNGTQWEHKQRGGATGKSSGHSLGTLLGVGLFIALLLGMGIVKFQTQDTLRGWTISAAGYSCWLAPGGDWSKTYCGSDSGHSHLPNPVKATG